MKKINFLFFTLMLSVSLLGSAWAAIEEGCLDNSARDDKTNLVDDGTGIKSPILIRGNMKTKSAVKGDVKTHLEKTDSADSAN